MSTAPRPRLTVVLGSHRVGRFGPVIGHWVADHAHLHGAFDVEVADLATAQLPVPHPRDPRSSSAGPFLAQLERADAVAIVMPEYNHSFPGILKVALDLVGDELRDTPVGMVTYGGLSGGLRAAEALRPVLSTLGAHDIADTVSFANPWSRFVDSQLVEGAAATEEATDRLLDELARYAALLRGADEPAEAVA